MMANHYRLESDPHMYINLDSTVEVLQDQQARLHRLSARVLKDIEVVTLAIVERSKETIDNV